MKAKRQEYLLQTAEDKGNGFRQVRAYAFDNTQTVAGNCCAATPCDFKLPRIFSLVKKIFAKKLRNQIVAHIFATDWLRKQKFKQLKRDVLPVIAEWLNQFRKIWETRFDQLDKVLSTIKKQKK